MKGVVFVGGEIGAAGFRLAGWPSLVPAPGEESAALERARAVASLVLIEASSARAVPAALLGEALAASAPLVLVVPDFRTGAEPPELARAVRMQLGLEP
jgi:vacuolar-type H+-ATPase subunit F/Vma7